MPQNDIHNSLMREFLAEQRRLREEHSRVERLLAAAKEARRFVESRKSTLETLLRETRAEAFFFLEAEAQRLKQPKALCCSTQTETQLRVEVSSPATNSQAASLRLPNRVVQSIAELLPAVAAAENAAGELRCLLRREEEEQLRVLREAASAKHSLQASAEPPSPPQSEGNYSSLKENPNKNAPRPAVPSSPGSGKEGVIRCYFLPESVCWEGVLTVPSLRLKSSLYSKTGRVSEGQLRETLDAAERRAAGGESKAPLQSLPSSLAAMALGNARESGGGLASATMQAACAAAEVVDAQADALSFNNAMSSSQSPGEATAFFQRNSLPADGGSSASSSSNQRRTEEVPTLNLSLALRNPSSQGEDFAEKKSFDSSAVPPASPSNGRTSVLLLWEEELRAQMQQRGLAVNSNCSGLFSNSNPETPFLTPAASPPDSPRGANTAASPINPSTNAADSSNTPNSSKAPNNGNDANNNNPTPAATVANIAVANAGAAEGGGESPNPFAVCFSSRRRPESHFTPRRRVRCPGVSSSWTARFLPQSVGTEPKRRSANDSPRLLRDFEEGEGWEQEDRNAWQFEEGEGWDADDRNAVEPQEEEKNWDLEATTL